jgi:two-component system secretion response regulator SsrB
MRLTARETQLLKLLAQGKKNREIAQSMNICMRLVERHREVIKSKAECDSTFQLGIWAAKRGLV